MIRIPDNDAGKDPGSDPGKLPDGRVEPVADWLQEVEFRKPASRSSPPAWRDRRYWRWLAAIPARWSAAHLRFQSSEGLVHLMESA